MGAFGYNPDTNTELFVALPPIQVIGSGTFTYVIPKGCVAYTIEGVGAGGSGGVARFQGKATGGSGGAWGKIFRKATVGSTSITAILGAGGAAVSIATSGATSGNDGSSTTVSDGRITLTLPPGRAGNATQSSTSCASATVGSIPTVNDGGTISTCLGSTSGAILGTAATGGSATGGGACGNPDGQVRANSGAVGASVADAEVNRATGGASINAGSGDCISTGNASTGGAGFLASAASTGGAGSGGGSAGVAYTGQGAYGGQTAVGSPIISDLLYDQGYGAGGATYTYVGLGAEQGGGGGAGASWAGGGTYGALGSHKGGTGGIYQSGSPGSASYSGIGGIFGASGAISVNVTGNVGTSVGRGGLGCGSGACAEQTNITSNSSGAGGAAFVRIQFFIRKP